MNLLRAEVSTSQNASAPNANKVPGESHLNRPEFRFHKAVIESWLVKSHMLDADSVKR